MVYVCDAIMGSGKTSGAITYMNERPNEKFVFITPYLSEAERIRLSCPELEFVEPSDKIRQYHFKKMEHTAALIEQGRNIATTHQAFKRYTPETLRQIRDCGYTLIIDENVDVLERYDVHPDDMKLAVDSGYVSYEDGVYRLVNKDYDGVLFSDLFNTLQNRELISVEDKRVDRMFYWNLPAELITSFKDVFVLTYLFKGQSLCYFMDMYDIEYRYVGVEKNDDGVHRFVDGHGRTPDYVRDLRQKIHVIDNLRMNAIGDNYHALSLNWFEKHSKDIPKLKNNISNAFRNIYQKSTSKDRMWGCYKSGESKLRGGGYSKSFVIFNAKATNQYRDRKYLAYVSNPFMSVPEKLFYTSNGVEVDEDSYSLSILIQWIWRSAIRDGQDIYLYLPSSRMRTMLFEWIERVSNGGDVCA